jgi:hypothetical protein
MKDSVMQMRGICLFSLVLSLFSLRSHTGVRRVSELSSVFELTCKAWAVVLIWKGSLPNAKEQRGE